MTSNKCFINGNRILLRGIEKKDAYGEYLKWFNDEEVCRFNSHHRFPYSEEKLLDYIENVNDSDLQLVLAIIDKKSEKHIGNISLQQIDYINRTAEFAIIIGEKEFWGKNYGKDAGELIIRHGFEILNLNRICCGTFSENMGMIKLALLLGFKEEGRREKAIFKNNKYYDVLEYGLLKENWKELK